VNLNLNDLRVFLSFSAYNNAIDKNYYTPISLMHVKKKLIFIDVIIYCLQLRKIKNG